MKSSHPPIPFDQQGLVALDFLYVQRDESAISALMAFIDRHPTVFRTTENLTSEVQAKLLWYISNGNSVENDNVREEIQELKRQLIGHDNMSVLDRLMCEEVTMSYMFMKYIDTVLVRHFHHLNNTDLRKAEYVSSRFARAVKTLQTLRCSIPDVQINVSQINVNRDGSDNLPVR